MGCGELEQCISVILEYFAFLLRCLVYTVNNLGLAGQRPVVTNLDPEEYLGSGLAFTAVRNIEHKIKKIYIYIYIFVSVSV
jgi:hypothetical protein